MENLRDAIVATIFAAAWADGEVNDLEKMALDRIMQRLGYSRAEIMDRIGQALTGANLDAIPMPKDLEGKKQLMRDVLSVCFADEKLNRYEVAFLEKLTRTLDLHASDLEALKQESEQVMRPTTSRPPGLMIEDGATTAKPVRFDQEEPPRRESGTILYQSEDFGGELEF